MPSRDYGPGGLAMAQLCAKSVQRGQRGGVTHKNGALAIGWPSAADLEPYAYFVSSPDVTFVY